MSNFPEYEGWHRGTNTCILLRLKNVRPHVDDWCGVDVKGRGAKHGCPTKRRALFWLLGFSSKDTYVSDNSIVVGCAADSLVVKPGDYVVLDDSQFHWVMSDRRWIGAAVQLYQL